MRVLLANAHGADASVGGAERYVADLAGGLCARGHQVEILSAFPPRVRSGPEPAHVLHSNDWRDDPVRRARNHAGDLLSLPGRKLARALAAVRPDIVHTNNLPGISTALWEVARRAGVPTVHTLHDYHLLCPRVTLVRPDGRECRPHPLLCGLRTRRLGRWSRAVTDVIAVSRHLWRVHERLFPTARLHVVRLPLAPFADRPLAAPRTPPRTIAYLGALERTKGTAELLRAAPALAELGLTVEIAGDGRLRAAVEAAAGPALLYNGPVYGEAKLAFFERADLAVVPSRWAEPGGPHYTVLEWLAAGRPVLASTRGGLGEARDRPGVVPVEPEAESIVEAVRRVRDEEAWHDLLGRISQVEDARDVERWLDEHEAVYRQATGAA